MLHELPARSAVIDGEIVASDPRGVPDFWRLFRRSSLPAESHVWAFDLLALNSKDLRKWSLGARQGRLQALLGQALLKVAEKHGLEGIVSKRRDPSRLARRQSGSVAGV
jgi:bifunctional non-homologous end joining protein LigD